MSAAKHLACFSASLKCPHLQTEDNNTPTSLGNHEDERRRDGGGTVQAEAAGPERAGPKQSPPRLRAQLWFLPFDLSELPLLISTVDTEPPSSAGNHGNGGPNASRRLQGWETSINESTLSLTSRVNSFHPPSSAVIPCCPRDPEMHLLP